MKISYRDTWGSDPVPILDENRAEPSWDYLAKYLRYASTMIRVHAKDQIPLWAPCTFVDGWTTEQIVGGIYALVFDLDDIDARAVPAVQVSARTLADHGLIHSTWNSETWIGNVLCTSLRVILPLSEPQPLDNWPQQYRSVARILSIATGIPLVTGGRGGIDLSCANPARTYYLPATDLRTGRAPSFDQW